MNKVHLKNYNWELELPMTWKELSESQFAKIMDVLLSNRTEESMRLRILLILFDLKWYQFRRKLQVMMFWPEELMALKSYLVGWCFKPMDLGEWKLKSMVGLRAHEKGLSNWSFGLFCFADTYFLKWHERKDIEMLNLLMACVFSKGVEDLDVVMSNASKFETVALSQRVAVALNYSSLRLAMAMQFSRVFNEKKQGGRPDPYGWAGVMDELSGSKFGNDRETESANLIKVLIHLDRLQLKQKD